MNIKNDTSSSIPQTIVGALYSFLGYFGDTDVHWSKKITWFVIVLGSFFLINDFLKISFNHNINSKIEQISKIELIKKESLENYEINQNILTEINNIENKIIKKDFILHKFYIFVSEYQLPFDTREALFKIGGLFNLDTFKEASTTLLKAIGYFLSIHFIWILAFLGIATNSILNKEDKKNTLYMGIFIIVIMFGWNYLLTFINSLFQITNISFSVILNIIINTCVIFWIILSTNKPSGKK